MNATKASGFRGARDAKWWTKDSKYGVKYQCSSCGKITLGTSNDSGMHWPTCDRRKTAALGTARAEIAETKAKTGSPADVTVNEVPVWDPKQVRQLLANVPDDRSLNAASCSTGYVEGFNAALAHVRPLAAQLRSALAKIDPLIQTKIDGSTKAPSRSLKLKAVKTLLKPGASQHPSRKATDE